MKSRCKWMTTNGKWYSGFPGTYHPQQYKQYVKFLIKIAHAKFLFVQCLHDACKEQQETRDDHLSLRYSRPRIPCGPASQMESERSSANDRTHSRAPVTFKASKAPKNKRTVGNTIRIDDLTPEGKGSHV